LPKQLHVLLSAYACLPNAGTEPGNGWNWAIHLAERGIQVHVLTVTDSREEIESYRASHPNSRVSFSYVALPRSLRHRSGLHYLLWQWAALKVARNLHRTSPFDLAHHVTYSSIHVPTQLWRLGIPTIFGPIGGGQVTPRSMLGAFGPSRRAEVLRTVITRLLPYSIWHRTWLQKMTIVLATNSDTLRLVESLGKMEVEPWFDAALPSSFFADAPRTFATTVEPLRLLWVGRMVPRKALPLTLDVLTKTKRPSTLTIAGGGLPEEEVHRMIAVRGLTKRVRWAGRQLSRDEVRQAYTEHDALLFASLRDSCPAQLVEAMGLGLPVITLDHHGPRDLVPANAGIKVPVTTPEGVLRDLAAAVDRYYQLSGEEKSAMSIAAWSFARNLSYTAGAELFEALYREILNGATVLTAFPTSARHMRTVDPSDDLGVTRASTTLHRVPGS
jgi:glycosyltransferase involved in cell wall biosynthesis